jgi:phosphoribosylformylglycinamidine synthase
MGLGITHDGKTIKSPTQVTFKGYAHMNDAMRFVTPDFKKPGASSVIVIDGAPGKYRLGGSALAQALGQIGDEAPRIDNASKFKAVWNAIQELVGNGEILAYHDCLGDGGLVTTLIEMAISGNTGVSISVPDSAPLVGFLFSQECRALIECDTLLVNKVLAILEHHNVHAYTIGITTKKREITITHDTAVVFHQPTAVVRSEWERISDSISQSPDQMNTRLVPLLFMHHSADVPNIPYNLPFAPRKVTALGSYVPKAIVLREEGVNGHIEMAAAHKYLGFDTYDITMSDLLAGKIDDLSDFRYLLLSGGFSFGDVFGSGKGWAAMFRFNPKLAKMLQSFIERDDTLITGVCNGFQVMTTLGLFTPGIPEECWPQLVRNNSEKFESQYPLLAVGDAPNLPIIMNGMEGMIAPGIVAHGDGKLIIPPSEFREDIEKQVALRYVDYDGNPTNYYPCNPNGSANGSTALTSPNKRNAGMMPHLIDRMFLKDQWPYMPEEWRIYAESPWLMLGINARDWLVQNR